jgi:hypothetical protein
MPDLDGILLKLGELGAAHEPEAGDAGDIKVRQALAREMTAKRHRGAGWRRRRIRIGGFAVTPLALLGVVATAAAATTAVTLSATTLFTHNPYAVTAHGTVNGFTEKVIPSTVHQLSSADIPDYGQVQVWIANTSSGGTCEAFKLPDGSWANLNQPAPGQQGVSGAAPACANSRQQEILTNPPVPAGQQPSPKTGQFLITMPLEEWNIAVTNNAGVNYSLYVGYVTADGVAATVRDTASGVSAPVSADGYFVLATPTLRCDQVPGMGGGKNLCLGGDPLQVLNAAGQPLKPDYTYGSMLPGYSPGPSQHS